MRERLWPILVLGIAAGGVAAILAIVDAPFWIIFAAVLLVIVGHAALQERQREEVETKPLEIAEPAKPMPSGFGRAMLEQMPLALLVISRRGRVVYGNRAAKEILPTFKVGDHFASLLQVPVFIDAVNDAVTQGKNSKISFSTTLPHERFYEASIGLMPAGSDFGDKVQAIVQIQDCTQDRRVEKMRSDFVSNASHELRTPLASILGYIETLQGHAKDDPEAREEFLKIMDKQATRMQRLVDDLMSLSRIELNEHIKPSDPCVLNELVVEAISALLPLQKKYGVTLEAKLVGEPVVAADRDQLNQVMANLIDNAMKYSGDDTFVKIYSAQPNLRYADMVGITISDQGAGIGAEHLHRLTERFYRVNAKQSRNKGGTGLGLAIVKHIVNSHGGELQIESTIGEGSKFTVWLPIL